MSKGPFEILEIRASGSYAAVCLAKRTTGALGRRVGLKVLRATLIDNPQILTRTRDEARVLSMLNHPNIVKVEELLGIQRRPVMVMEWVAGVSLRELLDHNRDGLPIAVSMEVICRTARALEAAQDARDADGRTLRIIHRDIKPANILLSTHGQVKVVDFGLSRGEYYERETSTVSTLLGSMGYMAPERFDGGPGDRPEIDVYSLGLTLAELTCGVLAVLPRDPDTHRPALLKYLGQVSSSELDDQANETLRTLITDMCHGEPVDRIGHPEVQSRIKELQRSVGLQSDLSAYAADVVAPMYNNRPRLPPRAHPAWEDICFLEDPEAPLPAKLAADEPMGTETDEANDRIREFMANEGWESQKRELKWLLALNSQWSSQPFLEVLQRATQPWWRFWARPANDAQVALSLEVLKHRLSPRLNEMARELLDHPDERISAAAKVLIVRFESNSR